MFYFISLNAFYAVLGMDPLKKLHSTGKPDLPYQIHIPEYIIYLKYNNIYVIPYTYLIKLWMYFWILVSFYGLDVNNNDEKL